MTTAHRQPGHGRFDPILRELNLSAGNGLGLLEEIHRQRPHLPVVVLSATELSGEQLGRVDAAPGKSRMDTHILARLLPAKEPSNA